MQFVTMLGRDDDGLWVDLSDSGRIRTRALLLATGAEYERIGIPEIEALNGAGVFYGGTASEASRMAEREVYVVGGANSAGQAALHLARYAAHVTLVVRGESLDASMSSYLVHQIEATPRLDVRVETEVVGGGGKARLEHLVLRDRATGNDETVPADGLFLMIGARPHTGWLPDAVARDDLGFVFTGTDLLEQGTWPLERAPLSLETSVPGVFAAGDLRHSAVRRVASAVGEGSVAVQLLHRLFAFDDLQPTGRMKAATR
jgi:thioredoxin reductase (NADPH)